MSDKTEQIFLSAAHSLIWMGLLGIVLLYKPMPLNIYGESALQIAPFLTAGMLTSGFYLLFKWNMFRKYKLLSSVGFWAYMFAWVLAIPVLCFIWMTA